MHTVIGVPAFGDVDPQVLPGVVGCAIDASRYGTVGISVRDGMIPYDKPRNMIISDAVEGGADYLLSLDADMIVPARIFGTMLDALREHDAVAASGLYLRRGYPFTSVWSKWNKDLSKWFQVSANEGVHEIDMTGLGCCLIDVRWIKEHLTDPWCKFERRFDRPDVLDDESLFNNIKQQGGKIVGVASVKCGHLMKREMVSTKNDDELRRYHLSLNEDLNLKPSGV